MPRPVFEEEKEEEEEEEKEKEKEEAEPTEESPTDADDDLKRRNFSNKLLGEDNGYYEHYSLSNCH